MKIRIAITAALLSMLLLTGCTASTENIDAALDCAFEQKYDEALEYLDKAALAAEDARAQSRARGIVYIGLARYDEAIEELLLALSMSNGDVTEFDYDVSYYLAVAQYKSGDYDGAIETYSAIIALRPNEANPYFLRGSVRLYADYYDDAIRDFNNAIDRDKKNPDLYINIYEVLSACGKEDAGQDFLDKAVRLDTKLSDYQKGRLYYYQGDYENARNFLEKARTDEGEGVTEYLGMTYEALGDTNYAASLYKTYLEKHPDDAIVQNQLGRCLMNAGEYDEALKCFEAALALPGVTNAQALRLNEIAAYEYKGDFKKAYVLMKAYLQIYPDDENAKREYKFLETR